MTAPGLAGGMGVPDVDASGQPMPPMPFEPEEDQIAGPFSDALLGAFIDYRYSGGRHYTLTFDDAYHVTFAMPDHPLADDPDAPKAPSLAYRAREIRPDLFLVHWIVKPAAIHVSLTIDLVENKLYAAAMMPPNRWEFFDVATIDSVRRP